MTIAERHHDLCCGHRVLGHLKENGESGPCAHLHGHCYRVFFFCTASKLNPLGMVIDFGLIKTRLCSWLDNNWDHRMLLNSTDPWLLPLQELDPTVVSLPFNPTAENLAAFLVTIIGPEQLEGTGATLVSCRIEETRHCAATYSIDSDLFSIIPL